MGILVSRRPPPAHQALFQSGWFVESLFTQTLIVHIIRTAKLPFVQSRATWPVLALTAGIICVGIAFPFLALGRKLGLEPLPGSYFLWLSAMMVSYIALVHVMKQWYIRRFGTWL